MTCINAVGPHISPHWMDYNPPATWTADELKGLDYLRSFEARNRDSLGSCKTDLAATKLMPAPLAISQVEKLLYPRDSVSSLKGTAKAVSSSLGTPKLMPPEQHLAKAAPAAAPPAVSPAKAANEPAEGFLDSVRNSVKYYAFRWFGWGSAPSDTTSETPLVGSPKEVNLSERDAEAISKALEQMNLAINKLITKPSEDSKESQSDGSSQEAELLQLKQLKSDVEILNKVLASFKTQVKSKELQVHLATDEISKNYAEGKEIQSKHLENAEEIESRMRTSALLNWVQLGAGFVALLSAVVSIALSIPTGGASLGWTAFAMTMLTNLAAPGAASLITGGAAIVQGTAKGIDTYQKGKTNEKRAENEGHKYNQNRVSHKFQSLTKESTDSMSKTTQLYIMLVTLVKSKQDTIQSIARQIDRN